MPFFGSDFAVIDATNKQAAVIEAGQVCAIHSSGLGFVLGSAATGVLGIGLAQSQMAINGAGSVITSGLLRLGNWTNAVGLMTLPPRAKLWLDINAGKLVLTPPTATGNFVQQIGESVSNDTVLIRIQLAIQL